MKNKLVSINKDFRWQWMNNPIGMLSEIKWWAKNRDIALSRLRKGSANNEEVESVFHKAAETARTYLNEALYGTWSEADFPALKSHLEWQSENEWDTLSKSWKAWSEDAEDDEEKPWVYYNLLWGQRENPDALQIYRACWNEDKDRVMDLVKQFVWQEKDK